MLQCPVVGDANVEMSNDRDEYLILIRTKFVCSVCLFGVGSTPSVNGAVP